MTKLVNFKNTISSIAMVTTILTANSAQSMDEPSKDMQAAFASLNMTVEENGEFNSDVEHNSPAYFHSIADLPDLAFSDGTSYFYTAGECFQMMTGLVDAKTVKSVTDSIPGCKILKNIHQVYSQPALSTTPTTLSSVLGNNVKAGVENLPGGNLLVDIAGFIKAPGKETLAQTVIECINPGTNVRVDGDVPEVAGNVAKVVVQMLPGGNYITQATGFLGKNIFGTPTLTEGIFRIFEAKEESDDEDLFVS